MNENRISPNDLKSGDVLLFSHTEQWESHLIAILTKSEVSHSALAYSDIQHIVEETPPHASISPIEDRIKNRDIHVMRLKSNEPDLTPVLNIANDYVKDRVMYSKANLVIVGMSLLFRKKSLHITTQKILSKLLMHISVDLMRLINKELYKDKNAMVCSQFVFDCYSKAGDDYRLDVNFSGQEERIINKVLEYYNNNKVMFSNRSPLSTVTANELVGEEDLLKELHSHILSNQFMQHEHSNEIDVDFANAVYDFSVAFNKMFNKNDNASKSPIESLLDMESYFVTPNDLMNNCSNLEKVGVIYRK